MLKFYFMCSFLFKIMRGVRYLRYSFCFLEFFKEEKVNLKDSMKILYYLMVRDNK